MPPQKKICLIHDMFLYRGWAERFNIMLARALGADLAALFFSTDGLSPQSMGFAGKSIAFGENKYTGGFRQIYLKYRVLFHTKFLREYDTVIFSNDSLSAIRNVRKDAKKVYYAHSIPRYLFDQREFYYRKVPLLLRPIYIPIRAVFERMYRKELSMVDEIYVNSTNLQKAMKRYLWRESLILHPPVDTDYFMPTEEKRDYYVSFSKLSSLKRVARTIEAFREMPDRKLLVIYGENDPQKDEIMALAEWCGNIAFLTLADNNELPEYVAGAIATVFIARNEDFGMVALESMSCGVPVIGVNEGGIRETVINGKTGILLSSEATKEELISAVRKFDPETALAMKSACIERAQEFSLNAFEKTVREKFL